jgi:hypothetical protein
VRRKRGRRSDVSGAGSGPRPGLWGTRGTPSGELADETPPAGRG